MRFSLLNLFVNLALGVIKGVVGFLSGSHALRASALYSINDVLSAIIVIVSLKVGGRTADEKHAYGHGNAEFIAIAMMSVVMVVGVFFILFYSLISIIRWVEGPPCVSALFVAILAMLTGELLARMGFCVARHADVSVALKSSAKHNRADAISSVAVIFGIAAAMLIHPICDPIAAMIVGVIIFVNCVIELKKSLSGLMDRALSPDAVRRIKLVALAQDGVSGVDFVKTREVGRSFWVDLGILVPENVTVARSDKIASEVRNELMRRSERLQHVEIYVAATNRKTGQRLRSLFRGEQSSQPDEAS